MIYLFDKDEQLIKLIKKSAIKSIEERQTLTDTRYISDRLSVELKALSDEVLARVEYVAVPTKANPHLFSLHFLATHENEGNTTMLEGAQVGIEELRKGIVEDKKPRNKTARPVIEELLSGTNWSARYVAETASLNTNLYYVSVFEALQKVCEVWDLEMQFFVEVSGNRIAARYIDFKRKIGKKVGTRLVYGTNALKLVQQVERTNLITAAIGRGKGEEVSSAEENESGQAGYGRKIDFSDIVWTKGANPVDKPKGQKYVEIKEATARYGIKRPDGMYPKVGIVEIETDDKNELLRRTYEELQKLSRPQATFKADVAYLKNAEIGDTIRVVRKDWQLDYETRIIEIAWDRLSDKATSITVGDQLNVSESKKTLQSLSALDDTISETVGQAQTKLLDHLISADGFNTNWYRMTEPPLNKTKIGDIWYKPDPEHEGEKIMLIWDGENWVEVVRTVGTKAITEKIEALKAESARYEQEFMQGLQEATTQADENAKAMREQLESQIADETQAIKDKQAQFEAGMSQDRTKLSDLTKRLTATKDRLASAINEFNTSKANLARAVEQANAKAVNVERNLSQTRQTLEQQAQDMLEQARQQTELRTLTTSVQQLANGSKTELKELSKTLDQKGQELSSVTARTKVVEDTLTGTQTKLTELTRTADKTSQKTADLETGLDGLKQRLTATETTSNETKRNQANYEATTNRKIAELTQSTQTLDGKIASANTKVEQTATAIRTELNQVEGRIPTSVGGRNYVRGSKEMVIGSGRWSTGTFRKSGVGSISTVTVTDSPVAQVDKAIRITSSSVSDIVGIAQDGFEIAPNTYTVTYWIRGKIGQKIKLQTWWSNDDSTGISPVTALTQNGWQKLTFTARKQTAGVVSIGYVYLNNGAVGDYIDVLAPKLETGTVSTDYSQAPEDTAEIMSSLKTTITQTGEGLHQLSTKVTNQDGLITSHTADIKRLNNEVSSKVSQTSYDTLTGRVTSAESLIQQQENAINQRLTATQVESAITAKGYQTSSQVNSAITSKGYQTKADVDSNIAGRGFATATTLENKVRETVEGYTREISRVEGLISTETSGNILLASNVGVTNAHSSFLTLAEPIVKGKTYTVVQHWRRSGTNASKGVPIYCIDRSMSADGTTQYVNMYYDSTIDSWTATFVSTVNVAKGTRIRFANSDYKNGPFGSSYDSTGSWAFTTLVAGKTPLSSWQPHGSEQATVTALNAVKSTADEHTRTLTSLQNDTLKKAEVTITSDKIVLGVGKEINGRTFSTMIAQNSQYVDIIAEKLRVSGNMIVDGTITAKDLAAGSVTAAQIVANAVTTEKLASNAVTADKLLADQALFNKLKANQAYLKTLFTTDAFAQTVKTVELSADKITAGTLNGANVNVINLNASNITSGRLSANMISGGVLSSLNGCVYFDLNNSKLDFNQNATIEFKSASNAIFRKRNVHTAFLHFQDTTLDGIPSVYASLGVTRGNHGINSASSGRFAGIRIFSTSATANPNGSSDALHEAKADQIELYGDKIILTHSFGGNAITLRASQLDKNYDLLSWMQGVKKAIKSLSNIWSHANNVNWDFVNSNDLRRAVYNELNSFGWGEGL